MVVTGPETFRYLTVAADNRDFTITQQELFANAPDGHEVSKDYTCHVWTKDTMQLLVCTSDGDMILCNHAGEFLLYIPDSPFNEGPSCIDSIFAYSRGVIVAGDNGFIWAFEASSSEEAPYKL